MALTRVTPSGWLQETGSRSRVTPFGWVQETTVVGGATAVPVFLFHYRTLCEHSNMAQLLKQSTAYTFQLGPFVDSTDGVTPETSLTIAATDVDLSKNGGAFADKTDATALTSTGDSQGYYDCALDTTDTGTLGKLDVRCYVSGALPVFKSFMVVPAHAYDGLVAGTDNLQVDTIQITGTAQTARDLGASVLLSSGLGTGQISLSSGAVLLQATQTGVTIPTVTNITNAVTLANGAHGGSSASLALGAGATISKADGHALTLTGGTNGHGLLASGAGTGSGIAASGGSTSGSGIYAVGDADGMGIFAVGGDSALGLTAGLYLKSNSSGTPVGLYVEDGAIITDDAGTALLVSSTGGNGDGVTIVGNGSGGDFVADITGTITTVTTATNVTTVNGLANGVITAASIATDAIDADALAADAVTEINTAVLSAISGIGTAGGAAINIDAATDNVLGGISGVTSTTTFLGTQTGGTSYLSTSNVNSVWHIITGTAAGNTAMDVVYQFLTGAGTNLVQATWVGYVTSANDTITISAWRHDTGAWESMTTIVGTVGTTTQTKNIVLYARHRGTSVAELGKVYLRLHCTGMSTPVVATDQILVSYAVTSRGSYADGAVWINTGASNTNTQSYVDGLPENPVSTIAAAITVATNLNLRRYRVANGSAITLAASHVNRTMIGHGYTLALGAQDVSGSYFEGVEGLSGTGTCPTAEAVIMDCHLNAVTIGEADFIRCHLMNTVTLSQASVPYRFHDCTGITSAKIVFAGASQAAVISKVSGVLTIAGMVSTNTLYLDGNADVTFDNTNNTGTVYIAGSIRLTNNGVTMNITDTARWSEDQSVASVSGNVTGSIGSLAAQAKLDVNAEVDTALNTAIPGSPTTDSINERIVALDTGVNVSSISGDTTAADRLEAILDATPTGLVVDDNDPDPLATAFETNLAEATNDHYNGAFLVFTSGALLGQSRKILDYDGTSKLITLAVAFTEAPAEGDAFLIVGRSE